MFLRSPPPACRFSAQASHRRPSLPHHGVPQHEPPPPPGRGPSSLPPCVAPLPAPWGELPPTRVTLPPSRSSWVVPSLPYCVSLLRSARVGRCGSVSPSGGSRKI